MSRRQGIIIECRPIAISVVGMAILLFAFSSQASTTLYDPVSLTFTLIHDFNTNSVSDPYDTDTDDDGLADVWEIDMFGDLTTASAITDYDNDSFTDVQEYLAGSDPRDKQSHLQIEFVFTSSDGHQTLWWESTDQIFPFPRSYDIQCVESLPGFANGEFITLATNIPSEGLYTAISLLQQGAIERQRFYRVKLHQR